MERQIPKNVRQIGNVSDTPKIYVEDYVDTFFNQLCEKADESPVGAFLVGDMVTSEEGEYVYIYGAVRMHELKMTGTEYVLDESAWKTAYEDCKQYFEDGEILGWFVAHAGVPLTAEDSTLKIHKKAFPKNNTIFILKDPVEREEKYFVHKLNNLMELGGHFTYYEKNPCMQNYMISTRKRNGVCPSETVEDQAAKDFRNLVRARGERQNQRRTSRLMYAMSACLVMLVVIMGVAMINNFDKMKAVQSMIENAGRNAEVEMSREPVQETSGSVTAIVEEGQAPGDEASAESPGDGVSDAVGDNPSEESGQSNGNGKGDETDRQTDTETRKGGDKTQGEKQNPEDSEGIEETESADTGETGDTDSVGEKDESGVSNGNDGIYIVEEGDTLAMISKKMYGDISHTDAISKMNGLSDGNLIYIGQKLLLP